MQVYCGLNTPISHNKAIVVEPKSEDEILAESLDLITKETDDDSKEVTPDIWRCKQESCNSIDVNAKPDVNFEHTKEAADLNASEPLNTFKEHNILCPVKLEIKQDIEPSNFTDKFNVSNMNEQKLKYNSCIPLKDTQYLIDQNEEMLKVTNEETHVA